MLLAHRRRTLKSILFARLKDTLLLLGTSRGFQIYRIESNGPIKIISMEPDGDSQSDLELQPGGIGSLDCLENLIVLVGGGRSPMFDTNKVILWDDKQETIIAEIEFSSSVRSVRLVKGRLLVALLTKLIVYQLTPLKKLFEFDMAWNEHSILDISSDDLSHRVLAFPARQKGQVQVAEVMGGWSQNPLVPFTSRIAGHSTTIASISVSRNGLYVATASNNGTLVRVWHSQTGALKHELRRGADSADIYSIAFNSLLTLLCVISDKNTLHLYNLSLGSSSTSSNRSSILSPFPYLPKYFSSDWSIGSTSIPDLTRSLIQFVPSNDPSLPTKIHLLCSDGTFSTFEYDAFNGGEPIRKTYYRFYVAQ